MAAPPADALSLRWPRMLAVCVLVLGIFELSTRVAVRAWAGRPYTTLENYTWSPYGLVRNNPGLTHPSYLIDGSGFRDTRDYTMRKPPNTLRIILLGGSVLYSGVGGTPHPRQRSVGSDSTISQMLHDEIVRDPAFQDVNVEVINAAVNFDRLTEIGAAYIGEYINWNADVVIVGGTLNSFGVPPRPGDLEQLRDNMEAWHPWRIDFERRANGRGFWSLVERGELTAASYSAAVGVTDKLVSRSLDVATSVTRSARVAPAAAAPSPARGEPYLPNDWAKQNRLVMAICDAMLAAGRRRQQELFFFWEHSLSHLDALKPMGREERWVFEHNRRAADAPRDALNDHRFYTWSRLNMARLIGESGSRLLDPLDALRHANAWVFIDDGHYTALGNRLMAGFIAQALHDRLVARAALVRATDTSAMHPAAGSPTIASH